MNAITTKEMEVLPGESVSRDTHINTDSKTVRMFNVSKNDKTGKNYKVNWTFDFSDCTDEDLLLLAARSTLIAYRKNFRGIAETYIPDFETRTINVKETILNVERKGLSKEAKAVNLMSTMSKEEIMAALAAAGVTLE